MNASKLILPSSIFQFNVLQDDNNIRLDSFVAKQFNAYSRSFFKKLIMDDGVNVNGKTINKPSSLVKLNDQITVNFPEIKKIDIKPILENFQIEIIHNHLDFLIIYKPAGILVHAAKTNDNKVTLVDWLLSKFSEISQVGSSERPGIVHRIDLQTSGLLIIPKNNFAHMTFGDMFKNRLIKKTYLAIVQGKPKESGYIDYPIIRHPSGNKMSFIDLNKKITKIKGDIRQAETHYKVIKYFDDYSLLEVKPITGRTHQIRVHLSAIGHPIIGDTTYGKKSKLINRHALHAQKLEFEYENQKFVFESKIPDDIKLLIQD